MTGEQRRKKIWQRLQQQPDALSASQLAKELKVSRQVVVGDVALLRAAGTDILSTPKGYRINRPTQPEDITFQVVCLHPSESALAELLAVVDNGGRMLDVAVEHPVYGQLIGRLNIASRYDAESFMENMERNNAVFLAQLTDGIHLHTISCADSATANRIKAALSQIGVILTAD